MIKNNQNGRVILRFFTKFVQNLIGNGQKIMQKCMESCRTPFKHDFETHKNDKTFTFERTVLGGVYFLPVTQK